MEGTKNHKKHYKNDFSFKKEERLCSKKIIELTFSEGSTFVVFPLKVVFKEVKLPSKYKAQAAFTVSKKNVKKAVHRNAIKRKMREVYRLNKKMLYDNIMEKQVAIFFVFIAKEIPDYKLLETTMKKSMKKLIKRVCSTQ